jgi:hypothetical protein
LSTPLHLFSPPSQILHSVSFQEKLINLNHRNFIVSELEDLLMFGIYVIILYIVILANKDSRVVLSKTSVEEMMNGKHTRTIGLKELGTVNE